MTLEKGNKVKVIGPSFGGYTSDMGKEFVIREETKDALYADRCSQIGWYPASSLRLAEEKMKIGDWVESNGTPKRIFRIKSILVSDWSKKTYCKGAGYEFYAEDLRKLTPEEIAKYQKSQFTATITVDASKVVAAIEKTQLKLWQLHVDERLSAIEKRQEDLNDLYQEDGRSQAKFNCDVKERLCILEGEMPEVCDRQRDPAECIREWNAICQKVLDNMREA